LKLLIWDVIIGYEINRIADIHICCNTCISIVEGILIDPSVAVVVKISTSRETCVHHATHVIVEIVRVIHTVHIVEIHVVLVLVEVVVVILVLILVVLISLISLFWIIIAVVIATCRIARSTARISILS